MEALSLSEHDRFFDKVKLDPSGCWRWTAYTNKDGYGRFFARGEAQQAHRFAYETLRQDIGEGMEIHHVCENKWCVNPAHLQEMTHSDHMRITENPAFKFVRRTWQECKNGHEFTEENTRWADQRNADGSYRRRRFCRECQRQRQREYDAKRKVAA